MRAHLDELIDSALKLSGVKAHIVHNGNLGAGLIDQPSAGLPSDIDLTKLRTLIPTRAA